jgi:hypothetical protein
MDCGLCCQSGEDDHVGSGPDGSGSCHTCHDEYDHEGNGPIYLGSSHVCRADPILMETPHDFFQENVSQQTNSSLLPSCDFFILIDQKCQVGA